MFFSYLSNRRESLTQSVADKYIVEAQHQLNWLKKTLVGLEPGSSAFNDKTREIKACESFLKSAIAEKQAGFVNKP
jgi:hypothetical protein